MKVTLYREVNIIVDTTLLLIIHLPSLAPIGTVTPQQGVGVPEGLSVGA
ncbi:hypothetical protein [Chryseobacterium contaminans]